jgi:hypothetical protein
MSCRGGVGVLLPVLALVGMIAVIGYFVPILRCMDCAPLYDGILGPGQPPEDWRIDCRTCEGRSRIPLARRMFGNRTRLTNPWLFCLQNGDGKAELPQQGVPMSPHADAEMRRALPILIRALRAKESGVAFRAGFFLGRIGAPAVEALPQLIAAAGHPSYSRVSATWALGRFKTRAAEVLPVLVQILQEPDTAATGIHFNAVEALGELGPAGKDAVPALTVLLRNGSVPLQRCVAETLGRIGPAALAAIPELTRAAADPDEEVSKRAAWALKQVSP